MRSSYLLLCILSVLLPASACDQTEHPSADSGAPSGADAREPDAGGVDADGGAPNGGAPSGADAGDPDAGGTSAGGYERACREIIASVEDFIERHRACVVDEDCTTLRAECQVVSVDDCSGAFGVNKTAEYSAWRPLNQALSDCVSPIDDGVCGMCANQPWPPICDHRRCRVPDE